MVKLNTKFNKILAVMLLLNLPITVNMTVTAGAGQ